MFTGGSYAKRRNVGVGSGSGSIGRKSSVDHRNLPARNVGVERYTYR